MILFTGTKHFLPGNAQFCVLASLAYSPGPAEGILEWGGGGGVLNRSRKGESSSVMPRVRSPGKIWKFKSS